MQYILPVIFRLIYGCGLRVSEAENLKNDDVNFDEGFIIIRETKNGSDRLLTLSNSLINVSTQYKNKYLSVRYPSI
jgi:integrase/recombinase XerD